MMHATYQSTCKKKTILHFPFGNKDELIKQYIFIVHATMYMFHEIL